MFFLAITRTAATAQDDNWTGTAGDDQWSNPQNWDSGIPTMTTHNVSLHSGNITVVAGEIESPGISGATHPPYNNIYGPEWGGTLNLYGNLNFDWVIAPIGDSNAPSTINMYGASTLSGVHLALGYNWWFNTAPYATLNMYDNARVNVANFFWGGHVNLFGGTLTTIDFSDGNADAVSDATRLMNLAGGTLVLSNGDQTLTVSNWIARGILKAHGGTGTVVVDTDLLAGSTVVRAAPRILTWTGSISSDWNNSTNWSPQQVPTASDHVIINSGTVTIPLNASFGTMDWMSGGISGSLTVATNGVLNAVGGGLKSLYGVLTNYGTVNWSGGDWSVNNNNGSYSGAIYNQPGGLFDIQCDQSLNSYLDGVDYHGSGYGFFNNAGTLRKSAGSGTTYFNPPLTNLSTVEANIGKIYLAGAYWGGASANLGISLGGSTAGTDFGRIEFSTPFDIEGSFSVSRGNVYQPSPGNTFLVLVYPSATNNFDCLRGLDLGNGIMLQPQFSSTGLTLLTATYITNSSLPQLFISKTPGGVLLNWPLGYLDWTLQATTNLASFSWLPISATCQNQALLPNTGGQRYFRLQKSN